MPFFLIAANAGPEFPIPVESGFAKIIRLSVLLKSISTSQNPER